MKTHAGALGVRLNREESQRKLLDLRLYELVLLYVRSDVAPPPNGSIEYH